MIWKQNNGLSLQTFRLILTHKAYGKLCPKESSLLYNLPSVSLINWHYPRFPSVRNSPLKSVNILNILAFQKHINGFNSKWMTIKEALPRDVWKKLPLLCSTVHQNLKCSAEFTSECPKGVCSSKPNCVSRCFILYPSAGNQYECWSLLVCAAGSCLLCSVYSRDKPLVAGVKNSLWTIESRQKLLLPGCSSLFS